MAPFDSVVEEASVSMRAPMAWPGLWIVGHRGSPVAEPENTLESLELALDEGANAVEIDLSVTRDGNVVLWHDDDPDDYRARFRQWGLEPCVGFRPLAPFRRALRKPTRELTLGELRRHYGYAKKRGFGGRVERGIPTLDEFFEWARTEPRLGRVFFDLKIPARDRELLPTMLERAERLIRAYAPRMGRPFEIVFESCEPAVVAELGRIAPHHDVVLDVEPHAGLVFDLHAPSAVRAAIRHRLARAAAQKPRSITLFPFATHRRIIERDLDLLRAHNQTHPENPVNEVICFLINDAHEMRTLIDLGVHAIQTDKPALLRRVLSEARAVGCAKAARSDFAIPVAG